MRRPQVRPRSASHLPRGPEPVAASKSATKKAPKPLMAKPAKKPSRFVSRTPKSKAQNVVKMKRHRGRRFGLLILLSVVLVEVVVMSVAVFSSALSVTKIEVTGTKRISATSIRNALEGQLGVSLAQVDNAKVAAQLQSFSLIESVDVIASPPHTLMVNVTERSPIAIAVLNGSAVLVDPAGIQVGSVSSADRYPVVDVSGDPRKSSNFRAAVDVLLALPSDLYPQVASISARSKDDVTLQLRGVANQQIVWGDGSQSALKSRVLAALFKHTKRNVRLTIDVSSPDAPVVRY